MKTTALQTICAGTMATGLLAFGGAAHAAMPPASPPAALREAIDEAVSAGNPAVLSYVRREGRSWQLAAGTADLASGRAAQPGDRWRIFSNTKSFVATVLLQLEGEGRLSLDDSIERWLPGVVRGNGNDGRRITVRQLLNHTSGIYDPGNDPVFGTDKGGHTPEQVVDAAMAHPPLFPAGQQWDYSNTNYLLAGMIVEAVSGHAVDKEIERRILRPLGLKHTSFPLTDPRIPGPHLHGYDMGYRDVTHFNPSGEWTAGAMLSTTADLARFDAALFSGRLLKPVQQRELQTTVFEQNYGLGVQQGTIPCGDAQVTVWQTDGGGPGFTSLSMTTPGAARQLVLVANVFDLGRDQRDIPGEDPTPDARPAYFKAITSVFCP
ncbi:D-alanyl-D-alanine carboxypeptidase [Actinoplanes sp. SE50]|uniref:serine hydrolase domain-containing protein n=1 Tax=unclassified Actinoplanes TaxID=2626549 RepID=UPI00023EC44A|nr:MULTISPECIES: serine hydrolase domain-containing protein [unclassified Actinoplanes]AEV84120.1 D-alanyl-D-alanine carboxypeptidase [Actinoplanes sp. SE50/110]ATO82512.1 D-alanyl-D-alanine carboxypeptidase [Actinoplanes sp. SE50]SLL99919.1 D-alanyl-D-alanine carboxypeptidase [Actinoplanes sp. SE50/110]